jgi:oxygen-independent coproporphyrinogen-3 oxidase
MSALGLYVHIPFCAAICNYCNFTRGLLDAALKDRYLEALRAEIAASADRLGRADTIYLGGGTPSLLSGAEVASLIDALGAAFDLARTSEVTLEANPETVSPERLADYRAAGVNRLSLGVQSFRDEELARLGRLHSARTAREAVRLARAAGFDNVSLDLMMWLPGQRLDEWLASVEALIDVAPDHASLYLLELYPNAPLRDEMAREGWSLAPDEDAASMYLEALARLDGAGYEQYEISNVCRPGRESQHNLKYWQDGDWLGFGCEAHSTRSGIRWHNVASTTDYVRRVGAGRPVVAGRRVLDTDQRFEEALITGLRLTRGVDLSEMSRRYGVDVWARYGHDLGRFVEAGLLVHDPGRRLRLTRSGMLLANEVLAVFIGPTVR